MYFKSKKISLLILGATALICSRTMLVSFDDPEGPNLLIVTVLAVIVYFLSLAIYSFNPSAKGILNYFSFTPPGDLKRLLIVIFIQILTVSALYFCLS